MRDPAPVHPDATWLYEGGRATYPGTLTQQLLMKACSAAALELGVRRKRTPVERERLTENVRHLLLAVVSRESDGTALGSMSWDLSHGQLPLVEAAQRALAAEYSRSRYRVLQWALKAVLGSSEDGLRDHKVLVMHEGRQLPIRVLSHEGEAGHAAAIAALDELRRAKPSPP